MRSTFTESGFGPGGAGLASTSSNRWISACLALISLRCRHVFPPSQAPAPASNSSATVIAAEAIRCGGVFLNADAVGGPFWPLLRDEWAAFMAGKGFTLEQAYQNLEDWAGEDMYFSVHEELYAMVQGGFEHPECFWRRGPIAILGARL